MSGLTTLPNSQVDLHNLSDSRQKGKVLPQGQNGAANIGPNEVSQAAVNSEVNATGSSTKERVEEAVSNLNDYIQNTQRKLNFSLDEESGLTVVKVFNADNGELIRQIPSEDAVDLAQKLNTEEPFTLFSAQV